MVYASFVKTSVCELLERSFMRVVCTRGPVFSVLRLFSNGNGNDGRLLAHVPFCSLTEAIGRPRA